MSSIDEIYLILFILSIIQSIAGVGILLIGTPVLLIYGYSLVEIFFILLPLSMLTSLIVLLLNKLNKKLKIQIDKKIKFYFIFNTIPSVLIGLILIKYFGKYINFEYLVFIVILFSIVLLSLKKVSNNLNKNFYLFFLTLTGIVHGLTNTGGSILALLFSSSGNKLKSRFYITYFYFFLALFHYLLLIMIFSFQQINFNFIILFIIIIFGSYVGNYLFQYINEIFFKRAINVLALISCCVLILN